LRNAEQPGEKGGGEAQPHDKPKTGSEAGRERIKSKGGEPGALHAEGKFGVPKKRSPKAQHELGGKRTEENFGQENSKEVVAFDGRPPAGAAIHRKEQLFQRKEGAGKSAWSAGQRGGKIKKPIREGHAE